MYNIYYKDINEITKKEKEEINKFILKNFKISRIKFYEKIIYYKDNNKIIGFAGLYYIDKYISINQLCIDYNYRNKGLATSILNLISEIYNTTSIILYIDKNKENTNYLFNFYIKRGFKEIDYLKSFNLSYERDIEYLMIKEYQLNQIHLHFS